MSQSTINPQNTAVLSAPAVTESEEHTRIRWGAVFGGAVAALGIWALLYAFGLAIGFSAVDPGDASSMRASGIFTGVWSMIAPIIALFIGGLIASRGAGVVTKGSGVLHGIVMWGVTTLIGGWAIANILSSLVGGSVSLEGSAAEAADMTARAFWGAFGALLLGLLASLAGSALGASDRMVQRAARARMKAARGGPTVVHRPPASAT